MSKRITVLFPHGSATMMTDDCLVRADCCGASWEMWIHEAYGRLRCGRCYHFGPEKWVLGKRERCEIA